MSKEINGLVNGAAVYSFIHFIIIFLFVIILIKTYFIFCCLKHAGSHDLCQQSLTKYKHMHIYKKAKWLFNMYFYFYKPNYDSKTANHIFT